MKKVVICLLILVLTISCTDSSPDDFSGNLNLENYTLVRLSAENGNLIDRITRSVGDPLLMPQNGQLPQASLLVAVISTAQVDRYQTRTGEIKFEASVPTFEPIEAVNQSVTIVLDKTNGNLASLALIKGFKFPIALMQEHFNENYIESDQYPKAVLRGTLQGFEFSALSDHLDHTYTFKGTLEMHGIKKGISFPVSILENNNVVNKKSLKYYLEALSIIIRVAYLLKYILLRAYSS